MSTNNANAESLNQQHQTNSEKPVFSVINSPSQKSANVQNSEDLNAEARHEAHAKLFDEAAKLTSLRKGDFPSAKTYGGTVDAPQSFDQSDVNFLKNFALFVLNDFVDRMGFSLSKFAATISNDGDELDLHVKMSCINMFGFDVFGKKYLSHCNDIGMKPEWFAVPFETYGGNGQKIAITGYDPETNRIRILNHRKQVLWVREPSFSTIINALSGSN